MTDTIASEQIEVLVDGGSSEGRLVSLRHKLVAVLVRVSAAEAGTGGGGGWFLEAGFGPCSILKTQAPDVFRSEDEALLWIEHQLQGAHRG
jgi:hypothetical protein